MIAMFACLIFTEPNPIRKLLRLNTILRCRSHRSITKGETHASKAQRTCLRVKHLLEY